MTLLKLPLWDFFSKLHHDDWPRLDFTNEDYWMYAITAIICAVTVLLLLFAAFMLIHESLDYRRATILALSGIIIDKSYSASQTHSGIGTAVMPNTSGGVGIGVVSTSSTSPERFIFFIKSDKIYEVSVDMQQYFSHEIGNQVAFELKIGKYSKDILKSSLL